MNPFNILNKEIINKKLDTNITIWLENIGRHKNTYISGWDISSDEKKKHIQNIKKTTGCNGSIKTMNNITNTIHLQGDHIKFMYNYLINSGIDINTINRT